MQTPLINKKLLIVLGLALIVHIASGFNLCAHTAIGSHAEATHQGGAQDITAHSCETCLATCAHFSCASHNIPYPYSMKETGHESIGITPIDRISNHILSDSSVLEAKNENLSIIPTRFITQVFRL
ncbi:MAG: hypothetical protein A3F16_00400 [Deltaproteobacteria bacterium RIFCSPHIGHO2_12_FULL_43_9]|nr:MAG: hypothetical protein A3F16_00400 [Deltaproteobacteria bacterium RIFCSPHIGHO2_12_FULL_43_9]